ncbi:MAG: InlB B-repeat-containing protein, partial [Clostridia bacterium]|nr:InlB B-repeat-containing protein [Clostridia bacterium]
AYTDNMVVCGLEVEPHEVKDKRNSSYYFNVKYSLKSTENPELIHDYEFRVRQANADINAVFETEGSEISAPVEKELDVESITIVYDSNTGYVERFSEYDIEQNVLSTFFGVKQKSITQIVYLPVGTSFRTVSNKEVECAWYELAGWGTDPDNDIVDIDDGAVYDLSYEQQKEIIENHNSIFTLYAKWAEKRFDIIYDADSGTIDGDSTYTGSYTFSTKKLNPDITPDKDKWTFDGWIMNGELIEPGKTVELTSGTVNLTAQWSCEVSFDSGSSVSSKTFVYGDTKIALGKPAKTGYIFRGWSKTADGNVFASPEEAAEYVNGSGECTLYAIWGPIKYQVFFDGDTNTNEDNATATQDMEYDTEYTLNENKFIREYTVTFNWNGGTTKHGLKNSGTAKWNFVNWTCNTNSKNYDDKATVKNLTDENGKGVIMLANWEYDTTYLTLPTKDDVSKSGYTLAGWFNESNNKKVDSDTPIEANTTLKAKWKCAVIFDEKGGTDVSDKEEFFYNESSLELPTTTRTGYDFDGWYAPDGSKLSTMQQATDYVNETGNCEITAHWQIHKWKITTKEDGAKITLLSVTDPNNVPYGTAVSFSVKYDGSTGKKTTVKGDETGTTYAKDSFSFTMPDEDVTISASSCLTPDTLITMADGSQKQVKDVKQGDKVLAWDFEKGMNVVSTIVFNEKEEIGEYKVLECYFSDGTKVGVVSEHGFFDLDLKKFVYLGGADSENYIGDRFVKMTDDGKRTTVTLKKVKYVKKHTELYSPVTFGTLNLYANGMMSMPGGITGLFNIYEVDTKTMMYDKAQKQKDIAKYGLYTFEDYNGMIPYEAYLAYNGADLKVAMGKGLLDWEDVEAMAKRYIPLM